MSAIAARGRGLATTVLAPELLAELEAARDAPALAAALAHAELPAITAADDLEQLARDRVAHDLAVLARWTTALDAIELDQDRHSVRAIVRGLAARAPAARRLAATVPTSRLPAELLAELAAAPTVEDLTRRLVAAAHPYAEVLARAIERPKRARGGPPTKDTFDLLAIEVALARRFAELARSRDRALRAYVAQVIDTENTAAAMMIAARGHGLPDPFVAGGDLVDRATFAAAIAEPVETARARLAGALEGTPLAGALFTPAAGALEDAALVWQIATQLRHRRSEPLGLAPALYALLRRRDEARHLRRAAWRIALGGAA